MNIFIICSASVGLVLLISLLAVALITLKANKRQSDSTIQVLQQIAEAEAKANEASAKELLEILKNVLARLESAGQTLRDFKSSSEANTQRALESNNAVAGDLKKTISERVLDVKNWSQQNSQQLFLTLDELKKEVRALGEQTRALQTSLEESLRF